MKQQTKVKTKRNGNSKSLDNNGPNDSPNKDTPIISFGRTISWFFLTVYIFIISITLGGQFITYLFYIQATTSLVMAFISIKKHTELRTISNSVKHKIKLYSLIIIVILHFDIIATNLLVMTASSDYINYLSILEKKLVGKEVAFNVRNTYYSQHMAFSWEQAQLEGSSRNNRKRHTIDQNLFFAKVFDDKNIYIVDSNAIETALLYNEGSKFNVVVIDSNTIKGNRLEKRYKRVMGGTRSYMAKLPEETVTWRFIDVGSAAEYVFSLSYQGFVEGFDIGGKRDEFYSNFIKDFKEYRNGIVSRKIWDRYYPTALSSLIRNYSAYSNKKPQTKTKGLHTEKQEKRPQSADQAEF